MALHATNERTREAWERVARLKPLILAHRDEAAELRRLPEPVAEAFMAEDVYRLLVPRDLGGLELDVATIFELGVAVSAVDASAGWNFGIGCGGAALLGVLPLDRITAIYSTPDCCMAGSGNPGGKAVAVEGGYRVTGRWAWASAIYQSRWVAGSAQIYDGTTPRLTPNGQPMIRYVVLPKDQATIHDCWFTGGMRGTGSTEWEVNGLFVPASDVCGQPYAGDSEHPAPVFRLPSFYFGLMLCAVGIGVARGAAEALRELASAPGSAVAKESFAHYAIAKAQAISDANFCNVREVAQRMWDKAVSHAPFTLEDRVRARRAYCHAAETSVDAVKLCFDAAGGAAIFEKNRFDRAMRDVHAVSTHKILSRRFIELAGQAEFGLEITNPLF